jgi:hypothetical protein
VWRVTEKPPSSRTSRTLVGAPNNKSRAMAALPAPRKDCKSCRQTNEEALAACQYHGCNQHICYKDDGDDWEPCYPFKSSGCVVICSLALKESGCAHKPLYCASHTHLIIDRTVCQRCLDYAVRWTSWKSTISCKIVFRFYFFR